MKEKAESVKKADPIGGVERSVAAAKALYVILVLFFILSIVSFALAML